MKIKKFRIRPRLGIVARMLRTAMSVRQLPQELEDSIPRESEAFLPHVAPVAFYQTWTREEIPAPFKEALSQSGWEKAIAISALVATIGPSPEEFLSELLMAGESQRTMLVTALSEDSADLALQFLYKLLSDDAKSDDCDVSAFLPVTEAGLLSESLRLTAAEQEGIQMDLAAHLIPRFTRVALVGWIPISRKKKLAQAPKKKST